MDYETLIGGLKVRGFIDTEGISGMGNCHKDEKHYVLLTDGLVIYSSCPFWDDADHLPNEINFIWTLEKWWSEDDPVSMMLCLRPNDPVFTFEEFDKVIETVDELKNEK